ncbi:MAG: DALR anticodon-binding domain-containing protein, partial [Candidatus Aerophobetes bacterium]|nr:DALR anticodon-binding domain-containing protein [Candidatus Aerophobetes bacterium]
ASTREGEFIPLKEVIKEVGKDACRFFILYPRCDSHLDFDLELAKKQIPENPVFYVQYAHARICSILKKAEKEGVQTEKPNKVCLSLLVTLEERELMKYLALLPDWIKESAESLEPHRLTTFLKEISTVFHQFYTQYRVISEDKELTSARLLLIKAVKIVIEDVLDLLGISAPHEM